MLDFIYMSQGEKSMQPVSGSNPGPFAYRANALPTELTGLLLYHLTSAYESGTVTYSPHEVEIRLEFLWARKSIFNDPGANAVTAPCWAPNVTSTFL
jgi:hypothetical protein